MGISMCYVELLSLYVLRVSVGSVRSDLVQYLVLYCHMSGTIKVRVLLSSSRGTYLVLKVRINICRIYHDTHLHI
jgi:hypothetical protein